MNQEAAPPRLAGHRREGGVQNTGSHRRAEEDRGRKRTTDEDRGGPMRTGGQMTEGIGGQKRTEEDK